MVAFLNPSLRSFFYRMCAHKIRRVNICTYIKLNIFYSDQHWPKMTDPDQHFIYNTVKPVKRLIIKACYSRSRLDTRPGPAPWQTDRSSVYNRAFPSGSNTKKTVLKMFLKKPESSISPMRFSLSSSSSSESPDIKNFINGDNGRGVLTANSA